MPCCVAFEPLGIHADCVRGSLLHEVARNTGIALLSACGGSGTCGNCRMQIVAGTVSSPTAQEYEKLGIQEIEQGYRLACQTQILENTRVYLPPASLAIDQKLSLAGPDSAAPFDPLVEEKHLIMQPPLAYDYQADWERLAAGLKASFGISAAHPDLAVLQRLPVLLRENGWRARVSIREAEVIDVRAPHQSPLGLALDIGTSKIAGYLVDMESGASIGMGGIINPQIVYGEDVIQRISHAMEQGGQQLQKVLVAGINNLIEKLCSNPRQIVETTVVGNTVMHHLLLGLPVKQLGMAPYTAAVRSALEVKARDLNICSAPGAYIYLLPAIAGFIGSDHVAMILATGIHDTPETILGIDIGTNTEIVLAHRGALWSTSCASGPALEGGNIRCGVRSVAGAIERVRLHGSEVICETVNGARAIGICGSGSIDAVAELFRTNIINSRGQLMKGPGVRHRGKEKEFILVPGAESVSGEDITITQKDIHAIQLAKAAVRTGIEALLNKANITSDEIDEVIITGGFGTYIDPASAMAIGMFPPLQREKFKQVGNAAGIGARRVLMSKSQRSIAEQISSRVTYVELMQHPGFSKTFARAMYIPGL